MQASALPTLEPGMMWPSAAKPLSAKAMTKIAGRIPTLKKCIDLAAELEFSVIETTQINHFDDMTALNILRKWVLSKGSQATGGVLYSALESIELKMIAEEYQHLLLGEVEKRTAVVDNVDEWLEANRGVLLDAGLPIAEISRKLYILSGHRVFCPTEDACHAVDSQCLLREQAALFLDNLNRTSSSAVDNFKRMLSDDYPKVLRKCTQLTDRFSQLRFDLDRIYCDYAEEKPFAWLDNQVDKPAEYILNTCLLEKSEAEKLMTERNASSASEQHRRDYLYANPPTSKLIQIETLFQAIHNTDYAAVDSPCAKRVKGLSSVNAAQLTSSDGGDAESLRSSLANAKSVGIYAAAGCGKTCCCIKVTTSHSTVWPFFRLVFFWRLREAAVQEAEDLPQLLRAIVSSYTPARAQQMATALLETGGHRALIILDGVDELVADKTAYVWRVLSGKALPEACLLVTSRPCALARKFFDTYNVNLELLGFTDAQASQLVDVQLGKQLAPMLNQFLDVNERLASLMSVPLFALFVCAVFRQTPNSPPSTRTRLYTKLLALLVRRSVSEERLHIAGSIQYDDVMSVVDACNFNRKPRDLLLQLSQLAQMAHEQDKVIFDRRTVKEVECSDEALHLGLVSSKSGQTNQRYSFLHLTVQEFLVAFGLAQRIECKEQSQRRQGAQTVNHDKERSRQDARLRGIMKELLSRRHSEVVVQFLAGQVLSHSLPIFFECLNNWLHCNWCAGPIQPQQKRMESQRRLLTCLECVKEAFGEGDYDFPTTLRLPETVRLEHTKPSDLSLLAKALKKTEDIQTLKVLFDDLGCEGTEDGKCSRVRTQTRRALMLLLDAVKVSSNVQVLVVRGPSATSEFFCKEGWRLLCDVVQHTPLQTLGLVQCGLRDEEVIELASTMKNNNTLTVLDLSRNEIGDGVRQLADVLKTCKMLEHLYVEFNSYGESTRRYLRHQLKHVQHPPLRLI